MFTHAQKHVFGLIDTGIDVNCEKRSEILAEFPIPQFRENNAIHTAQFGSQIQTTVLISDCELAPTSSGGKMLKMKVYDSLGSYPAQIFEKPGVDLQEIKETIIDKYRFIDITADVSEFPKGSGRKTLQIKGLKVDTDKKRSPEAYLSYLPRCMANMEDIIVEVYLMLDGMREPYRTIGLTGLRKHWDSFVLSPAARRHHHAYIFGLLEHTWGLLRLAYYLTKDASKDVVSTSSRLYILMADLALKEIKKFKESGKRSDYVKPFSDAMGHIYWVLDNMAKSMTEKGDRNVDRDFILASIIWHDIGKIHEYTIEGKIDRHPLTGIVEHRVIGPLMFQKFIEEEDISLDEKEYWHFMNILSSHHGKVEWGSPTMPQTTEGWLVHLVDFVDSQFQGTNK